MEIDLNLDEPIDAPPDGGLPEAPKPSPKAQAEPAAAPAKRLRLPLSFQLQVLAALFLMFLACAAYFAVTDSRAAANRAAHLSLAGEIGVLTERMARLAPPAAQGMASAQQELKAARAREAKLLALLDGGGELDGKTVAPAVETLRTTLAAVQTCWAAYDKTLPGVAATPGTNPPDGMLEANQKYARLSEAVMQLRLGADDALNQPARNRALIAGLGSLAMLMLVLFFRVFNADVTARQALLAQQRRSAEEANAATQAAIHRLMDEIRHLADGDLTARASIGQDITGTIAEAMNYAIAELSVLVRRINDTAHRVATATGVAARTSEELLAASEAQSQEIRRAGGQVLMVAQSMREASGKAEQSAGVARQSLDAASKGATAVAASISGMDGIRGQIQETSKRIKRLGESSQEIGEIVELISDITEQTNVLALNAAIQAASAGEAGRGFSVVAEEVQRLAERSAAATRRIAVLVKTIQSDTQGAVAAMENSTQGVIEGARLSNAAGDALADISIVSRQLTELIEGISNDTRQQAEVATQVARAMREILRITEQTGNGTRSTALSIGELAELAVELKNSVAGFKV
ncbi:twitching motility protein PilJ [Georgfuchsia toluolica]|uniref:Twitching motility protein PilJ n=1 Tax=Georgfuchsia toluolica TaxID=424218 RepID=A0A916N112_9PROT|nr:methyl-accepting chemotaxis protein [Georgfuchsia toluolica]CAG4884453.1 twitching motility protein PilJ [Georgfuchsia toluolica]